LEHFLKAKAIRSEVTARQLNWFRFKNEVILKKAGEKLIAVMWQRIKN